MSYFTMSKFLRKEDLYKAKAEYLESALKEVDSWLPEGYYATEADDGLYYDYQGKLVGELK